MKRKALVNADWCKGCGYCIEACPKKAIVLSKGFNPAGYHYAVVDGELCIGCGSCYTICPDYVYTIVEE